MSKVRSLSKKPIKKPVKATTKTEEKKVEKPAEPAKPISTQLECVSALPIGEEFLVAQDLPYSPYGPVAGGEMTGDRLTVLFGGGNRLAIPSFAVGTDKDGKPVSRHIQYGRQRVVSRFGKNTNVTELAKQHPLSVQSYKGNGPTGTDPEIFVRRGDGSIMPAWEFLQKKSDKQRMLNFDGGSVGSQHMFWDGYQAEFDTLSQGCHESLAMYVANGLLAILREAQKVDAKAKLDWSPCVDIDPQFLAAQTKEHNDFGCLPSINAYGHSGVEISDPTVIPYRFAGCHIHFGFGARTIDVYKDVVKKIDSLHGLMMISLLEGMDDPRRRQFYGRAGEFRMPTHGLEYRVNGSAILCSPITFMLAFDTARFAAWNHLQGPALGAYWNVPETVVEGIINNCDVSAARKILKANDSVVNDVLKAIYGNPIHSRAKKYILNGWRSVGQLDVSSNWQQPTNGWGSFRPANTNGSVRTSNL